MNSNKITNLATPTADTDAATKAYVDAAATPPYITTTRGADSSGIGGGSEPAEFCPIDWTIVTSWNYTTKHYKDAATQYTDWTETLCSK